MKTANGLFSIYLAAICKNKCYYIPMHSDMTKRRLARNELIFRRANEKAQAALKQADKEDELPVKKGQAIEDIPLHLYCECSDKTCKERIVLTMHEYDDLHNSKRQFILKPGHEIQDIEKVIVKTNDYIVAEKFPDLLPS